METYPFEGMVPQVEKTLMPIVVEDNARLKLHEDVRNTFHYKDVNGLSGGECQGPQGRNLRLGMTQECHDTK